MNRLDEKRQRLINSLDQAVELILSNGDVKYILCVRMRDPKTQKVLNGILFNLSYESAPGQSVPATPGMLMDVILEAMLDESGPEKEDKMSEILKTQRIQ